MTLSQLLSILKARKWAALIVFMLTVTLTVGISLLLPKKYIASAAVVVDSRGQDPIAGIVLGGNSYMATQIDIIMSDRVARRVVQLIRLTENQQLRSQWLETTQGQGDFTAWLADFLKRNVDVRPARESTVLTISYSGTDASSAAALANAYVRAYQEISLSLRTEPAKRYNGFFDDRARELRTGLEAAQAKLSAFQKEHGILATDERLDIESQRLNELSSQLVALQAITADSRSRTAQAQSQADQLQDVINNPVVAGLRTDIGRQEAKLQELSSRLGDAHPQVQELRANVDSLKLRIESETRRVGGSVGVANTINASRETEIRVALEAQRQKVLRMKVQRDELASMTHDARSKQAALDTITQRLNQTSLESQASLTNIALLSEATVPSTHASPNLLLNGLLSVIGGILLGIGYALAREAFDRRVRSVADVSEILGLPVLGGLPKPTRGQQLVNAPLQLPRSVTDRLPRLAR